VAVYFIKTALIESESIDYLRDKICLRLLEVLSALGGGDNRQPRHAYLGYLSLNACELENAFYFIHPFY